MHGNITIPGASANDGLEASVFSPKTGLFYVAVPSFNGNPGGLASIDTSGQVQQTFHFDSLGIANISLTGLAIAANGQILVVDGNSSGQSVIFNPTTGTIVATLPNISGGDQVWYDPTTGRWFVTGRDAAGNRSIAVVDSNTDTIVQMINLNCSLCNFHSVSVDPISGEIFVPMEASTFSVPDTQCPMGCVAVFADQVAAVPEPSTWAMMLIGFAGLGFAFRQSRRKVSFA
ncbi:MAG: PEP-CTERM sorting domain-containing protein [Xanthobacteraceae bacterium]|nr:PEP-CTERM sorting domain-containing protein [Xanthobacteraceae bacterium]